MFDDDRYDPEFTTRRRSERSRRPGRYEAAGGSWYLVVRARESGEVVGVGMRTAPFEPRPAYLLPMPDVAARLVARTLFARGEVLGEVDGAIEARACTATGGGRR